MNELILATLWLVGAIVSFAFFFRPALHELMYENGVRKWKRLLLTLGIGQTIMALLVSLFYAGMAFDFVLIPILFIRYLVAISFLAGAICASLMYRH